MPDLDLEPCYFGAASTRLFGCYHAPRSTPARAAGVILCYPLGQEYIRAHRTYRLLAARLAEAGFPVLRFDFAGTGDSPGNCEHGRIPRWLADLSTACDEMRKRRGPTKVCLVGLRLGGTLAMMHAAQRGGVDGIVLWDPIVDGRVYVDELTALHRRETHRPETTSDLAEILGFPLTTLLRGDLEVIDLLSLPRRPAPHVLVVDSDEGPGKAQLSQRLERLGVRVEYHRLAVPKIWIKENKTVVPHRAVECVTSWIAQAYP